MIDVRNVLFVWIICILLLPFFTYAECKSEKKSCKQHPDLKGECFKVRGRLRFYNGGPVFRIWPVGTKRILGVVDGVNYFSVKYYNECYVNIPDELLDKMEGDWHKEMFADFLVCPFRDDEPGVMRPICVESAENIFVRDIPEK
jgi:hypothetical protein